MGSTAELGTARRVHEQRRTDEECGMRFGNRTIVGVAVVMAAIVAFPSVSFAQSATTQPNRLPRNNVKGGTLATNRPGVTINKSIAAAVSRNKTMIQDWGGATYGPKVQNKKQVFLTTFFESMFSTLTSLVEQLTIALQATTTTGT
jgi:hypothetical protein